MVDWASIGDELGFGIRIRQVLELVVNGGAAYTTDSLSQLRIEADALFDDDATSLIVHAKVMSFLQSCYGTLNGLCKAADELILDVLRNRLFDEIDATNLPGDTPGLIGYMAQKMRDDSKTVLQSTVAVGVAVTAGGSNVGTGSIKVDMLDNWNLNNMAIQNENFTAACYSDAVTGGQAQHAELFQISGSYGNILPACASGHYPGPDGAGYNGGGNRLQNPSGVAVGTASSSSTIGFEYFTLVANIPDKWTKVTGTAGTNISESAAQYLFGAKSLLFTGDGGGTLMDISQDANDFYGSTATDQKLDPKAHYLIGFWSKSDAAIAAGTLDMYMTGTGYTAGASEKATKDYSGTPPSAAWTFYSGVVKMPKAIPTDMAVHLKWSVALTNTKNVWVDGPILAKMYHVPQWGINVLPYSGGTAFIAEDQDPDRFGWTMTNDFAGLFSEWITRRSNPNDYTGMLYGDIGIALPSSGAASAEFAETKAQ